MEIICPGCPKYASIPHCHLRSKGIYSSIRTTSVHRSLCRIPFKGGRGPEASGTLWLL